MPLSSVTRFPAGLAVQTEGSALGDLGVPLSFKYAAQVDDFFKFTATDWIATGTGTLALLSGAAGVGGVLSVGNSAGSGDETSIQYAGGNAAVRLTVLPDTAKELFFGCRAALDSVALGSGLFGLAVVDTTPITTAPTDGIFFRRLFGASNPWTCVIRIAGVEVVATSTLIPTAAEVHDLGFAYTPQNGKCTFFDNGAAFPFTTPVSLPATPLAVVAAVRNGSAVARALTLDHYYVEAQR